MYEIIKNSSRSIYYVSMIHCYIPKFVVPPLSTGSQHKMTRKLKKNQKRS